MQQVPLSNSRFHMWRAVFALAHIDGTLSPEEKEFCQGYLKRVGFTDDQKQILLNDLETPQSVNQMLIEVSQPTDEADFFQFAQMLAWADGDYDQAEQAIIERLTAEQMNKFNKEEIAQELRQARKAAQIRRSIEDEAFKEQAKVANWARWALGNIVPWMEVPEFKNPDEEEFYLWRAVFALAHADHDVTDAERGYIDGMMEVMRFTDEQRSIIENDLNNRPHIVDMFDKVKSDDHLKRFFIYARPILWCDGKFAHEEEETMKMLVRGLGDRADQFLEEIDWLTQPPDAPPSSAEETGVLQTLFSEIAGFSKQPA